MSATSVFRAVWDRCAGRAPTAESRVLTSIFLRRRILLVPASAVLALGLVGAAQTSAQSRTELLYDRLLPAVDHLDAAGRALDAAHREVLRRLPLARTDGGTGLVGLGDTYRMRLAEADQQLGRAARTGALDRGQEQELRVISGLVTAYDAKVAWAQGHGGNPQLRNAGLDHATAMLCHRYDRQFRCARVRDDGERAPTAVQERIRSLRTDLRAEARDTSWLAAVILWPGAVAALVVFCLLAAGTTAFLRRELLLRGGGLLAAALLVVCAAGFLAVGTAVEVSAQREAAARPGGAGGATDTRSVVWREEQPAGVALALGVAGALGCALNLRHHGREYFDLREVKP
jgi:hypothetical protein